MRKVLYILGELEDADLQWLIDAGELKNVPANTEIIREGGSQDRLYIVIEGELLVLKGKRELARLGPGEVVGDMSLLDSRPPTATVKSVTGTRIFGVTHSALRSKLALDTSFAARFYRALCVFLANRLSRADALIGAEGRVEAEADMSSDEISPEALEGVALAGARFDWFLQRVGAEA